MNGCLSNFIVVILGIFPRYIKAVETSKDKAVISFSLKEALLKCEG